MTITYVNESFKNWKTQTPNSEANGSDRLIAKSSVTLVALLLCFEQTMSMTNELSTRTFDLSQVDLEGLIGCVADLLCCEEEGNRCVVYYVLCSIEKILKIFYLPDFVCLAKWAFEGVYDILFSWGDLSLKDIKKMIAGLTNCLGFERIDKVLEIVDILKFAHTYVVRKERIQFENLICDLQPFVRSYIVRAIRHIY